jgi:hypothetical protein
VISELWYSLQQAPFYISHLGLRYFVVLGLCVRMHICLLVLSVSLVLVGLFIPVLLLSVHCEVGGIRLTGCCGYVSLKTKSKGRLSRVRDKRALVRGCRRERS